VVRAGQCQGMDSRLRGNDDGALPWDLKTGSDPVFSPVF